MERCYPHISKFGKRARLIVLTTGDLYYRPSVENNDINKEASKGSFSIGMLGNRPFFQLLIIHADKLKTAMCPVDYH